MNKICLGSYWLEQLQSWDPMVVIDFFFPTTWIKIERKSHKCWWFFCSTCFLDNHRNFSTNVSLERNGTGNATLTPGSVLSFESTTLWPIATINCITVAFIFSKGKPFRKPVYTNCEYMKFNYSFHIFFPFPHPPRVAGQGWRDGWTPKLILTFLLVA